MRTAIFHGALARQFGKEHKYDAATIYLLMQGLILQLGDKFKDKIASKSWTVVIGKPDRKKTNAIEDEQVHQQLGAQTEVHFFPVIKGQSGAVRAVLGVVLIVAGVYFHQPWMIKVGAAIAIGGVSEMLAKKPSSPQSKEGSNDPNYFFSSGLNTNDQGGPIPIVFGRVRRAGTLVISKGIDVGQIA